MLERTATCKLILRAVIVAALLVLGLILWALLLRLATEPGWHCAGSSSPCPECAAEREKEAEDAQ